MKIKRRAFIVLLLGLAAIVMAFICCNLKSNSIQTIVQTMTKNRTDALITVGEWKDGVMNYHLYGMNGVELSPVMHTYAVGSITKTFTGALIAKLQSEKKLNIDSDIACYLPEIHRDTGITLKHLITHTSGLKNQWEDVLEKNRNATFDRHDMCSLFLQQNLIPGTPYYSNFGSAMAGTVAAQIEGGSFETVLNDFIQKDLKLADTKLGGTGDLNHYWTWHENDEMMADGAVLSNVKDMISYGVMNLKEDPSYLSICHEPLAQFSIDYNCGFFWMIDKDTGYVWHNGEISMDDESGKEVGFQSFLGFSKENNTVVVVLSNIISYDKEGNAYTDLLGYSLLSD